MNYVARFLTYFKTGSPEVPGLEMALERAIAKVDHRLPQARGWPERYRRPLGAALAQARQVAQAIPGPVELDAVHFQFDPLVHALFVSPRHMQEVVCASQAVQDYAATGAGKDAYLLLTLCREEKLAFGIDDEGGVLRRDVPQRHISFTDHLLTGPAPTLAEARELLTWTLFDRFLERVAVGFQRLRDEKARLTFEKDLALERLRRAGTGQRPALQKALDSVLRHLGDTMESLELNRLHEVFETVLSHPEDCLHVEERALILDRMNLARAHPTDATVSLTFTDINERYQRPRTAVIACFRDIGTTCSTLPSGERFWSFPA